MVLLRKLLPGRELSVTATREDDAMSFEDRETVEAMADSSLSAKEREAFADLNADVRKQTRASLHTNCATGESISPSGALSDRDVARLEQVRSDALERYRRRSG